MVTQVGSRATRLKLSTQFVATPQKHSSSQICASSKLDHEYKAFEWQEDEVARRKYVDADRSDCCEFASHSALGAHEGCLEVQPPQYHPGTVSDQGKIVLPLCSCTAIFALTQK
jgi:hypothetical protein